MKLDKTFIKRIITGPSGPFLLLV
ncbi:hypothetical protein KLEP7_gp92 [Pseudaeromonas phage vB_PpeM_ KLEP7]|nr:hypothetical protein KLEP7_gp92 [Pseudaeromonas phage vB_PpeM_ KLEP7]